MPSTEPEIGAPPGPARPGPPSVRPPSADLQRHRAGCCLSTAEGSAGGSKPTEGPSPGGACWCQTRCPDTHEGTLTPFTVEETTAGACYRHGPAAWCGLAGVLAAY